MMVDAEATKLGEDFFSSFHIYVQHSYFERQDLKMNEIIHVNLPSLLRISINLKRKLFT